MARSAPAPIEDSRPETINDVDLVDEMQESFLEYAYSVIYARALPDARDGLKPVQRRILYQMAEMGLRPDRSHVKSARVVGEVMGKLHPHGDSAIYDALVRMAQAFTLRLPLIDGHGNFGSLDDGPAAARYTEARLEAAALAMTDGLDEDVVNFVPNYDNKLEQPEVLPAAYPNLLINGASGIAVGMATNMAPHNLVEVIGATRHLIANPAASLDELMSFIPGPDLPTGGTIVGLDGIRDAYESGRGSYRTRARVSIEQLTARKTGIVVTELPYLVGPERVIEKIKDGLNSKKISGISDVTDLTDRHNGLRLVIGVKTGFNPEAVLEQLYKQTPLEEAFSINNVALVDGAPKTLGLKELLQVYIDHRVSVVTRRSAYRLKRRQDRLHLVEGLLIAILDIDEVIQVIRQSDDTAIARSKLIDVFDLSELQAEYILDLQLRRLTKFSRIELETERDKLRSEIAELERILGSTSNLRKLVSDELAVISDKYGTPRRTLLTNAVARQPNATALQPGVTAGTNTAWNRSQAVSLEAIDTPCRIVLSTTGRVARVDLGVDVAGESDSPISSSLSSGSGRSKHDAILSTITTTSRTEIGAVTSLGRLIRFTGVDMPALPTASVQLGAGISISDYLGLDSREEQVLTLVDLASDLPIALGTANGVVKRVTPGTYPKSEQFELISLKENDKVVGAYQSDDSAEFVFASDDAQLLRFASSTVRPQGCAAGGMAGISLSPGARAIYFGVVPSNTEDQTVVVSIAAQSGTLSGVAQGSAKVSSFSEYPAKGRATGGVRTQRFLKGEDALEMVWVGPSPALAVGVDGSPRKLPEAISKRDASGSALDGFISTVGYRIS